MSLSDRDDDPGSGEEDSYGSEPGSEGVGYDVEDFDHENEEDEDEGAFDREGRLADEEEGTEDDGEEEDEDEDESEGEDEDEEGDDYGNDDNNQPVNGFIDVEAWEEDSADEEDRGNESEDGDLDEDGLHGYGNHEHTWESNTGYWRDLKRDRSMRAHARRRKSVSIDPSEQFPQFLRLPPEIRRYVWEYFCPELDGRPRVLDFAIERDINTSSLAMHSAVEGPLMDDLTREIRTVAAVHRESRAVVLGVMPDELVTRTGIIRFNRQNDIVLVPGASAVNFLEDHFGDDQFECSVLPGFTDRIVNLGFDRYRFDARGYMGLFDMTTPAGNDCNIMSYFLAFPHLEKVYFSQDCDELPMGLVRWCGGRAVHRYQTSFVEVVEGLDMDTPLAYAWPRLDDEEDKTQAQATLPDMLNCPVGKASAMVDAFIHMDEAPDRISDEVKAWMDKIEVWPIVRFLFREYVETLEDLVKADGLSIPHAERAEESDQIDRWRTELALTGEADNWHEEPRSEEDEEDEELNDFIVDDRVEFESGSEGSGAGSRGEEGSDDSDTLEAPVDVGGFSPIESAPETDEDEGEGEESARPSGIGSQGRRARNRRVVADDDEDEDGDGGEVEGEGEVEDEDEDGGADANAGGRPSQGSRRRGRVVLSEDEDEDGDDEEDDGVGGVASGEQEAKLSLVERLQRHREENPVGGDDSESEEGSGSEPASESESE